MKIYFVFNPKAGQETVKKRLGDIIELFSVEGHEVTVAATTKRGDATEWISNLPEGVYDRVICAGGDGTLDEAVEGLNRRKEKLPLGYIPAGSTNDFARSLGLPVRILDAAKVACGNNLFACDVGSFNKKAFIYVAAFGAFTEVSYGTPQDIKNMLGHAAYIAEGVKHISDVRSYRIHISVNGIEMDEDCIFGMITNSESIGGFKNLTGNNIELNDGLFEVTLVKKPKSIIDLNESIGGLFDRRKKAPGLIYLKSDRITFTSEESIAWTLDGEFGGDVKEALVEDVSRSLMIAVKNPV